MPERCSLRSIARRSGCISSMSRRQQTIVDTHVDDDRSEYWQARRYWHPDEIPYGVKARQRCLIQQQPEGEFHFGLGGAGGQVQDPHVVAIGPLWLADAQRVIGATERKAREQIVVVTILGKGPGLAH